MRQAWKGSADDPGNDEASYDASSDGGWGETFNFTVNVTDEDEYFPPPRELRELMPALDALVALSFGGDPVAARNRGGSFSDDRAVAASDALEGLARRA